MKNSGFTLIELLIVIAIIGILSSVAIPSYQTYHKRTRFSDVVMAATAFKTPADIAAQTGRISRIEDLDAGNSGIPYNLGIGESVSPYVNTVEMEDGQITAVASSELDNAVFRLTASYSINGALRWAADDSVADSCQSKGYC